MRPVRVGAKKVIVAMALLVLAFVAGASLGPPTASAASESDFGNPAFCAPEQPARDFGLPSLPPVRELVESEAGKELGRPAVSIYGGWSRVMPRPQEFGYGFSEDNYDGPVRVDWTVTAQLWSVDAQGSTIEEVGHSRRLLKVIDAAHQQHIGLTPPNRRGFYRFDLQFEFNGEIIGSYSAYLKLVPPSWRARLALSRTVAHPGQMVLSRVENLGSEQVNFGEAFSVQRLEHGSWTKATGLGPEGWLMWLGILGPGGIGQCSALRLPKDVAPGRYRIVKEVGRGAWPKGKGTILRAPFEVIAST